MRHQTKVVHNGENCLNQNKLQRLSVNSSQSKGIRNPHPHDVLGGRGNAAKLHSGNVFFRKLVSRRKTEYRMFAHPYERKEVSLKIFEEIKALNPPGRFLVLQGNEWFEINEPKALGKISQALRELVTNNRDLDVETLKNMSRRYSLPKLAVPSGSSNSTKRKFSPNGDVVALHGTINDTVTASKNFHTGDSTSVVDFKEAMDTVHQTSNNESIKSQTSNPVNVKQNVVMPLSQRNISIVTDGNLHSKLRQSASNDVPTKQSPLVSQYCEEYKDEDNSQQLKPPAKKRISRTSVTKKPVRKSRSNKQTESKNILPIRHQKVVMPLSYIGQYFANSALTDESKYIFEDIADLGKSEDAFLRLPSIIGSLCERLVDLEVKMSEYD